MKNNFIGNSVNAYLSFKIDDPNPLRSIYDTWNKNYWSDWNLFQSQ